jgi:hypothetical protein
MGCAETSALRLPDNYHQAARDALAHRPRTACGSRRSLAVVPLNADQRYDDTGGTTGGLAPYPREWAGRVAVGEGPEAGLLGEPTWAGAINRASGNRPRSKAEAQPGH